MKATTPTARHGRSVRLSSVNDPQVLERIRSFVAIDDDTKLRSAIDLSARGLGARLPNDVTRDLARDLPPLLAEPLMAGSGESPADPNRLYTLVSERSGAPTDVALELAQTVFGIVSELGDQQALERARAALPPQWADLLHPIPAT